MNIQKVLQEKIAKKLDPQHCEIINESHLHRSSNNKESHFNITIVSDAFENIPPVKRHQKIYALFSEELDKIIHALSLHTYSPQEWNNRKQQSPAPTPCKHL